MPTGDPPSRLLTGSGTVNSPNVHSVTFRDAFGNIINPNGNPILPPLDWVNPYGSTTTTTIPYNPSVDEPAEIAPPKCFSCGREVESISMYVKNNTLVFILKCHDDERRIDVSLKRFKGDKEDAIEWFTETFQWAFDEEAKWRKVKPDLTVETVHADRKILSDWLDNI